jgi:NADH-quinone oxidoreductase subunit N
MTNDLWVSINAVLPLIGLVVWACILLLVDLFIPNGRKGFSAMLAALGLIAAGGLLVTEFGRPDIGFLGMLVIDDFSHFISLLLVVSGLISIALSYDYLKRIQAESGEFYVLLLLSISGMMLMGMAADLIIIFLALELLSIPLYVLAGIALPRLSSEEAGIKYFLLGAFSSGILIFGSALVYGACGSTSLRAIADAVQANHVNQPLMLSGAALVLVGLGFKVAVVPFHMWTPDVYQGAPSAAAAFMAVGAKTAGFAALLRFFVTAIPALAEQFTPVLWGLAALTMILGNFAAISQTNIKRLLAYSSISQAGYILMALVPFGQERLVNDLVAAALYYLAAYALTNFAAWSVVISLEKAGEKGLELDDYAGLGSRHPAMAAVMAIAMLSFTGIPPTLGFVGKFFLFRTVIQGGFIGLALIGVLTSLISAYYYLRVVVMIYMRQGDPEMRREPWLNLMAFASAIAVVILSIIPAPLFKLAYRAVLFLF